MPFRGSEVNVNNKRKNSESVKENKSKKFRSNKIIKFNMINDNYLEARTNDNLSFTPSQNQDPLPIFQTQKSNNNMNSENIGYLLPNNLVERDFQVPFLRNGNVIHFFVTITTENGEIIHVDVNNTCALDCTYHLQAHALKFNQNYYQFK